MENKIYVWDKFVRFFHWSLVVLFLFSYLSGENESSLHVYSGYAITILISARVVWGFIGTAHARFSDFIQSPSTIIEYSKDFISGKPDHYVGHNPLGGLMVLAMIATLFMTTLSGMKLYAVEENAGPFANLPEAHLISVAHADSDDDHDEDYKEDDEHEEDEEFWEEVHESAVNLMILLVLLHIAGVFVSSHV